MISGLEDMAATPVEAPMSAATQLSVLDQGGSFLGNLDQFMVAADWKGY
jgi:hypothetical protein